MKRYILFPLLLSLLSWNCSSSFDQKTSQESISPSLMEEYISSLASDKMEGRNTPSPGLDSAAEYIAGKFRSFGLKPVNGSYFQQVELGIISLEDNNSFTLNKNGKEITLKIKDDFVPFEITGSSSAEGEIVFCGYGIDAPEYKYNDYDGIDVNGKIVIVLRHEPGEYDSTSIFNKQKFTEYSNLSYKAKTAAKKGAVGLIVLNDPLNHTSLRPIGFPWPSLSKIIPKDALPMMMLSNDYNNIPIIQAGESLITELFGSVEELTNIQKMIDADVKGYSSSFPKIRASITTTTSVKRTPANNVVAYLEGSDPDLKKELLVIGAHYDHVGIKKNPVEGEDNIFNGADDNASGTAGVLALAKAFSQLEQKPKRSILFITFAGEEKGLYGSEYYVNNPLFPLENTVAMLNMDMIGRNGVDSIFIVGHSRSPELKMINQEENSEIGFTLIQKPESSSLGGSDHAPFLKKGIAALFYFSGMHEDYHKVTDEPELINFDKAAKVAQLVFRTAFRVSNDSSRYRVTEKTISYF